MLTSQFIPCEEHAEGGFHSLLVEEFWVAAAVDQLRRYEEENRAFRLRRVLPPAAPLARAGSVGWVLVLALFGLLQWSSAGGHDWLARGASLAGSVRAGELWRAVTALTLHQDLSHLLSNLLFGLLFAHFLFHSHGGGVGALALLASGALGNLTNALAQPAVHGSIGASTAVFGAVGLLCGSEARARHLLREPQARRAAPIGAALVFLLYLGVGEVQPGVSPADPGPHVDVFAHVFGLVWGLVLGGFLPFIPRATIERRGVQLACALATLVLLALAWVPALRDL